ncbi:Bifunctional inhibitor/plant lipid transfer protein/seed storage helical domain protein [Raphanus sativus]|nr:Bifunctional inhibitor/plant lipid transfer protein/seed storage helical domain protein [Raphanus sativus]
MSPSPVATPAPGPSNSDCSSVIYNMMDCLSYITPGSNDTRPTKVCCGGILSVLQYNPNCICVGLASSKDMGIEINNTRAHSMPTTCKLPIAAPHCAIPGASAPGASTPVSPSAGTPMTSPSSDKSPTSSPKSDQSPTSPTSDGSPTSPKSDESPTSPTSDESPTSPTSDGSPTSLPESPEMTAPSPSTGITNFWSSTFVLPKACISKINPLCGAFLWHGSSEGSHSARVTWEIVILAKEEGCLGCCDLVAWYKACSLKLIWLIFSNSGSIWVAGYKAEFLKGSLSNLWTTMKKQKYYWFTNKLLKHGSIVYDWITVKVGSGREVRFWTDNWSPVGNIQNFLAPVSANQMGIPSTATLHDLFIRDRWNIRPARSVRQVQVQAHFSSISLS